MQIVLQIFTMLGALCMFLYGMTLMSEGLQKAAGDRLRSVLAMMTSNPFNRVITGIFITALIQSSSATTVMVVSFVNAGLMNLTQSIGVIMGANIGTTITAWLISLFGFKFDISIISLPFMAIGFVFMMSKKNKYKNVGQLIVGFALLFLGLSLLKSSVPDLNAHPEALAFIQRWTGYGFGSVLIFLAVGTILTIVLQASAATMALTLVMVHFGWIPFEMAAAMVLGENIGTTITANLAASVANVSAKRAALAHTIFNVIGVIWLLIIFRPFLKFVGLIVGCLGVPNPMLVNLSADSSSGYSQEELATAALFGVSMLHTMFNLCNTLIQIWFVPQIEQLVKFIIKTPKGEDEVFRLKFISHGPLSTAELSLDAATHEIQHFAEICYRGFAHIRETINEQNPDLFPLLYEKLVKYEDITNRVELEIASYISKVSHGSLSERSENRIKAMYKIIAEMESLGDFGEAIGRIVQRKIAHGKAFDNEQLEKLNRMMDAVDVAYKAMMENLRKPYADLNDISNAYNAEERINAIRNSLRAEHVDEIEEGTTNYQTGVYFMDIISEFERMGDILIDISEAEQEVEYK